MTKIKIDDDVSMLTDKQLKINILQFLDTYKNILGNNFAINTFASIPNTSSISQAQVQAQAQVHQQLPRPQQSW